MLLSLDSNGDNFLTNKMREVGITTENYEITENCSFITYKSEPTTISFTDPDDTTGYTNFEILVSFLENEGKFSVQKDSLTPTSIKLTVANLKGKVDGGVGIPFLVAVTERKDIPNKVINVYNYYMSFWVKQLGESYQVSYTIYKGKNPYQTRKLEE